MPTPFTPDQLTRFAEAVLRSLQTPMVILDAQFKVVAASPPFCRLLRMSNNPQGQELFSLDQGRWDVPELRQALEILLPQHQSFDDVKLTGYLGPHNGR